MDIPIYQVDAFTDKLFGGNPAAVCPLDHWPVDELLLDIARENNLSETGFFVKQGDLFDIRWFTPAYEVDLCGHATLAAGHVLFQHMGYPGPVIRFNSRSGILTVGREGNMLSLDFPIDDLEKVEPPEGLIEAMGMPPVAVYKGKTDYLAVYRGQEEIENLQPDQRALKEIDARGIIATARGMETDFVSRFFAPRAGIPEDPVTGSAHTTLTPYWSMVLSKNEMTAVQLSHRRGHVRCKLEDTRVILSGQAVTFFSGTIQIS